MTIDEKPIEMDRTKTKLIIDVMDKTDDSMTSSVSIRSIDVNGYIQLENGINTFTHLQ
jgi:hypothetical protein